MQFNKEFKLTNECRTLSYKNFSDPANRELLLGKSAFERMAKPLACAGPDFIYLSSKDILTKSFFTKMELLSTGMDNTIKNVIVRLSIFGVKNAKLSPYGYYIEHIQDEDLPNDIEIVEERPSTITSFFDWYSINEFLRVDEDDKISRNLDVVFDPRYIVFDKSSVFEAEEFRIDIARPFTRHFLSEANSSTQDMCASAPRGKWLPPLMWRFRGVKYGKFKRAVS